MEQFQKIVQGTIEYFRLFHVRHVRGVFDNFQTRVANPIMHELCVGDWPDRIVTADDDECGHVNARKTVGVIPPRGRIACGVPYEGFRTIATGLAELKLKSLRVSVPPICCWS